MVLPRGAALSQTAVESDRMAASERNELRNLVYARANALQTEAIRSGGSIPPEQLEELRQLASLVEIRDAAQPVPPRRRWPLIALFVFTLIIVSVLLFVRRGNTEVELDPVSYTHLLF